MEQSNSDWKHVGRIVLVESTLTLPNVPQMPGLYRLRFDSGAVYIGEANDLQRRLCDYLVYYPSSGVENEFRLNKRLKEERGAEVEIMVDDSFITKSARCVREYFEIKTEKQRGADVINGGTIADRIAFHRAEIDRLEQLPKRNDSHSQGVDLEEDMHRELLDNPSANALADELARRTAKDLGFGREIIDMIGLPNSRDERELTKP